jgi:hypothetical protein
MKKIVATIISGVILCLGFFNAAMAQDGFFSDAETLRPGTFSLGVQSAIYTEVDNEAMLFLRGAYGVNTGLSLYGKLGLLRDDTYIGGHFKYRLTGEASAPFSFSALGGAYAFGDIGLKIGGIISKNMGQLSLYSGLTFEPLFTDPDALTPLLIPVGVDIPIGNQANFVLEADIAANDDADFYQALHFGLNFYL